jgi:hypothetical protein
MQTCRETSVSLHLNLKFGVCVIAETATTVAATTAAAATVADTVVYAYMYRYTLMLLSV